MPRRQQARRIQRQCSLGDIHVLPSSFHTGCTTTGFLMSPPQMHIIGNALVSAGLLSLIRL
jgi:hypothetical protein